MSSRSEQWNEFFVKGNQIDKQLDDIERVLKVAELPECAVSIYAGKETVYPNTVLPDDIMGRILHTVTDALREMKLSKEIEFDKLMGKSKPAYVNPVFEAAVQEMEQSIKKSDPVEDKLQDILQTEAKKNEEKPVNTDPSLNRYPAKKTAKKQYPENMDIKTVKRMYVDEGMTATNIAAYFKLTTKEVANFITRNKISRSKPAETERP